MPYRHDDLDIEQRLKGELDKAREAYGAASREFDLLIKGIPSGIPQPDGGLRIQQASEASRAALQNYLFAGAVFPIRACRKRAGRLAPDGLNAH